MRGSRHCFTYLTLLLFVLAVPPAVSAQEDLIGDFWIELEPFPGSGEEKTGVAELSKRVLTEAQYVFGGMIYGFTFRYTPYDSQRKISEAFELVPIASIVPGDPALTVKSTRTEKGRLHVRIIYRMKDFQYARVRSRESNILRKAGGRGEAAVFNGFEAKIRSISEGIKNAIREYARTIVYNKPREILGTVFLADIPVVKILDGSYVSSVVTRLEIREIRPYSAF